MSEREHEAEIRTKARSFFDGDVYFRRDALVEHRCRLVRQILGSVDGARVFDAGCGDGRMSLQLLPQASHVTLLDLSEAMLNRARRRVPADLEDRVTFFCGATEEFEVVKPFDLVLCLGVFAHVPDAASLWDALTRLVAPGGRLLVQLTDRDSAVGWLLDTISETRRRVRDGRGYGLRPLRYGEMVRQAEEHGFDLRDELRYWRPFPGMSKLPNAWLLAMLSWTHDTTALRGAGSEWLLSFTRRG